jgi:cytochrome b involved in lipid metabolism
MPVISAEELAKHKTATDMWIVVDGKVLDVTGFQKEHPGGAKVLKKNSGKDASKMFHQLHNDTVLGKSLKNGNVKEVGTFK